jgi:hypothetical protein
MLDCTLNRRAEWQVCLRINTCLWILIQWQMGKDLDWSHSWSKLIPLSTLYGARRLTECHKMSKTNGINSQLLILSRLKKLINCDIWYHTTFLIINELDALISQIYFWKETLHVSDSFAVHHQEFFTVHTAMVYVIQVMLTACEQDQDVPFWSCSQAVCKTLWRIPLMCVQWKIPDDGQNNCPKHVEFHSKNKFEKLVHLVGLL